MFMDIVSKFYFECRLIDLEFAISHNRRVKSCHSNLKM
jgi:hypothetical protein